MTAIDSCFTRIGAHQDDIAVGTSNGQSRVPIALQYYTNRWLSVKHSFKRQLQVSQTSHPWPCIFETLWTVSSMTIPPNSLFFFLLSFLACVHFKLSVWRISWKVRWERGALAIRKDILKLASHIVQKHHAELEAQETHWDKANKELTFFNTNLLCLPCLSVAFLRSSMAFLCHMTMLSGYSWEWKQCQLLQLPC